MANARRVAGDPDRFEPDAVGDEAPPRIEYSVHQPNLDAEQLGAVRFKENRAMLESWGVASGEFAKINRRLKGK